MIPRIKVGSGITGAVCYALGEGTPRLLWNPAGSPPATAVGSNGSAA